MRYTYYISTAAAVPVVQAAAARRMDAGQMTAAAAAAAAAAAVVGYCVGAARGGASAGPVSTGVRSVASSGSGAGVYESERAVHEYLQFHFGGQDGHCRRCRSAASPSHCCSRGSQVFQSEREEHACGRAWGKGRYHLLSKLTIDGTDT